MARTIKGRPVSGGMAIGRVLQVTEPELTPLSVRTGSAEQEAEKFRACQREAAEELRQLCERAKINLGQSDAEIIDAQLTVLFDEYSVVEPVLSAISAEGRTASQAIDAVLTEIKELFSSAEDDYMRQRAGDVEDLRRRLLMHALGVAPRDYSELPEGTVLAAVELTPSETIRMELSRVVGIAVETGGFYSHVGILTRNLGIPTVCGVEDIFRQLPEGETVVVDGDGASVAAGLSDGELLEYRAVIEEKKRRAKRLESYRSRPSVSASGTRGLICANIGSAAEAEAAAAEGAEGVGLFRSEFLYMDQTSLPDEETQFQAYVKALKAMDGKPVIIRTLDAGGDKQIPGLKMPAEDNPFLGCRALRLCLKNEELFLTQLRALLRAGREGTLEIMFPMVSGLEELRRAKAMLKKAAGQLRERGIEPSEPKVGIMIEIPSAALMAEALAGEADFFSIGTNDLIQYTLAAERGNPGVEDIYSPYHPAVLRLIAMTAKAAAKAGIVCGMCGEMAADLKLLPALWGMGVRELSMSAKAMTAARETLSQWSDGDCEELARAVLSCGSEEELRKVCGAAAVLSS